MPDPLSQRLMFSGIMFLCMHLLLLQSPKHGLTKVFLIHSSVHLDMIVLGVIAHRVGVVDLF